MPYFAVPTITWRALAAEFGNWNSVWKRFSRLRQSAGFEAFFAAFAALRATAHLVQMFDSTLVRADVSAAGAKAGKKVKRSGFGFSTKIPVKTDLDGPPIGFPLTGGEASSGASDSRNFEVLLDIGAAADPRAVVADKGSDAERHRARASGLGPVIRYRSNPRDKPKLFAKLLSKARPKLLYKARARIEQMNGKINQFKRIARRCEKPARNSASFLALPCGFILIKSVHTA